MNSVEGVTFARVARSEWTKLLSLRSAWLTLACTSAVTIAIAGVIGWRVSRSGPGDPTPTVAVARAFLGVDLISLVLGVFGVVLMTGEYSFGTIRATLTAVPRRLPVLAAKALALVALAAPIMLAVCFFSYLFSEAFVPAGARVGLSEPGVVRAILGAAAAAVASALIGLGLGTIVRHTAGAITAYVAGMLVLPALLPMALPASVRDDVIAYVPVAAGQALYAIGDGGNPMRMLAPGAAALVLLAWVVAVLAAGAVMLYRRDA